jgi:hypothetical protein
MIEDENAVSPIAAAIAANPRSVAKVTLPASRHEKSTSCECASASA